MAIFNGYVSLPEGIDIGSALIFLLHPLSLFKFWTCFGAPSEVAQFWANGI
jgi:hypothetical protein